MMFFVVQLNDGFNFPLGLIKYIVIVVTVVLNNHAQYVCVCVCVCCITDVWMGGYVLQVCVCVHACVCVLRMCEGQNTDKNS